ncbi:MAG: hypothetical protein ACFFG0_22220 [Candidatus Thorarchaeota archaeon]
MSLEVYMDSLEIIKEELIAADNQSLDMRAQRMEEVHDFTYDMIFSPTREYLVELDKLYVNGHFMATIIFSSSIVEYLLRQKLYLLANLNRINKATLGVLCNMARRYKILPKDKLSKLFMLNEIRNIIVHTDTESEFTQELMDAQFSDMTYDPLVQRIWFFSGSNFSLMAKTCAEIAREFAADEFNKMMGSGN